MASASSYQPNKSLFTLSDQEILTKIYATPKIYATHVYDNEKLDVESLLFIAENILNHATLAVDNALLGTQATTEQWEEKTPKASFSPPLCTLKHISCEMNCKAGPSDEIAQETTLSILEKLSSYSWDAKAVLTLASFALEYGEFCVLAERKSSGPLVNSVRTLKRAPVLLKHATLQKHHQAFVDLNKVIRATLEVIKCIFELEKLSNYDTEVLKQIQVDVYWAIITIVASTTQLSCIFSDKEKKQELNHYAVKLNDILPKLEDQIAICKEQREETEAYRKLVKFFGLVPITELLTGLIDPTNKMQPLNDWSTKKLMHVEIDVLKMKNVLLFISDLDISDADDISILRSISNKIGEDHYKIVWIPFMEKWTEDQKNKFESLQSNMPGYIARYNLKIASCRFIKEQWHFKGKPLLVVLNSQGRVECENAMHMIRAYGVESFPFTKEAEETLLKVKGSIVFATIHIKPEIPRWIEEKKYIFLYGGKEEWIQQFTASATRVRNDELLKEKGISIELVAVEKEKFERFWTSIESMFISKAQWKTETHDVGKEIQKLLSYKNESAWTVFTKGSSVLVSVSGTTVLKALEDFNIWKENLHVNDFETAFKKECNDRFDATEMLHICSRIDIALTTGITTETMRCSHCQAIMETYMSFKCCHKDGAARISIA